VIDITTADLVLAGGMFGGALLRGPPMRGLWRNGIGFPGGPWPLPCTFLGCRGDSRPIAVDQEGPDYGDWDVFSPTSTQSLIDCMRPEAQDHIVRVLHAGEACTCPERRKAYTVEDWSKHGASPICTHCNGTGYTRPRHDLGHVTQAERAGKITSTVAAAILWVSCQRVEAGLGPVLDALRPWKEFSPGHWQRLGRDLASKAGVSDRSSPAFRTHGWYCLNRWRSRETVSSRNPQGHEFGSKGKACADRAALAAGYALLDGGSILLPHPDGTPRRLDLGESS